MAGISAAQAEQIIALLTEIRDTTAAGALVAEATHAEAIRPRLEREHLQLQQDKWRAGVECEAAEKANREELARAKMPRLWAGGVGIATVRVEQPAPVLDDGGAGEDT